ncbi:MAG: hypothetical protein DYG94_12590 [Leptolyngbya sp. PLA3]|nr:MAG: hypothetical protein EDM82_12865 [Cyanobacteria bacterium CYA]MCE7969564.1 hypothetical protein [Leptolyngbya sp. PL-A3]
MLTASCGWALAQEVGSREWFEKAREIAAKNDLPPDGTYFEFRQTYYADRSEADYRALAGEVSGNNIHPKWQEFVELGRRLSNGGDIHQVRVWMFDREHWRVSMDLPFNADHTPWKDGAKNGSSAWRLTPDSISLLATSSPERGYDVETSLIMVRSTWRYLVTANLGGYPGWETDRVERIGDEWEAALVNPTGTEEQTFHGAFTDDGRLRIVRRVTTRCDDRPQYLGGWAEFTADDGAVLPMIVSGLVPAKAVKRGYPTPGQESSLWQLVAYHDVDGSQRDTLLATPKPGSDDPLRSLTSVTGLIDKTNGTMAPVADGKLDFARSVELPASMRRAPSRWLQPVIATVLGVIVTGLILVRIKRK